MAGLGAVVSFFLVSSPSSSLLPLFLSVFFLTAAGNVVNDIFDAEMDAEEKPWRPIPSGLLSKKSALSLAVALFSVAIYLAFLLSPSLFALSLLASLLLVVYPWKLKEYKLAGNLVVSLLVALVFVYGALPAGLSFPIFVLASSAFLANLSREIVKDLEDFSQPEKRSLPKLIGKGPASKAAALLLFAVFPVGLLPDLGLSYFALLSLSYLVFALSIRDLLRRRYAIASRRIKTGMAIVLFAFVSSLF